MNEKYVHVRRLLLELYEAPEKDETKKKQQYGLYLVELRKLAYRGVSEAQYDLAQHYEDIGFWGVVNPYDNVKKRFYWYTKAVENNHAAACNDLASMYEVGAGCEKSIAKAKELYKKGADLGDDNAKGNYRILLRQIKNGEVKL